MQLSFLSTCSLSFIAQWCTQCVLSDRLQCTWSHGRGSVSSSDLSNYYEYVTEYKEATSATWQELLRWKHSETASGIQSAPLSGLKHNTEYDMRLTLYRVVRSNTDKTDSETRTFKTACTGKSAAFFASLSKCLDLGSAKDTFTIVVYFMYGQHSTLAVYSGLALVWVCLCVQPPHWGVQPLKWIHFTLQPL